MRDQELTAALERAELTASLATLVAALSERYRLAMVLRHIQGFEL